jgi:GntR family transcriptional regulator
MHDPGSCECRIRKIHLHNEVPFAVLESYVEQGVFSKFPHEADRKFKIQRLIREAGVEISAARQEVTVSHATPDVAKLLDYVMGGSLIRLRSWRFGTGGHVIYATVNLYRGDLFVLDYVESDGAMRPLPWLTPLTRYRGT